MQTVYFKPLLANQFDMCQACGIQRNQQISHTLARRCCYKLRDVSRLGVCSERLGSARRMLARAHGPHQERLRLLHGGFSPEQAM
jgi:hypothetical protein